MEEKTYKTRVEISLVVEIDVAACCDDNAGAEAEVIAGDVAAELVSTVEYGGNFIANYGIRCIEVSEADYEKGE